MTIKKDHYVVPSADIMVEDNFLCADSADGTVTDFNEETFNWE